MQQTPSVSVCFPAYNEEATVAGVLEEAHRLLSASGIDYEILVCNDGSADRTKNIIEETISRLPNFRFFNNPRNLGINKTFELLYRNAGKQFIFLNSVDREWKTEILFEMLPLAKDWDVVIAARRNKPRGIFRVSLTRIYNFVPLFLFGVRTFDAGSVKLMRRELIQRFPIISISPFSEAERLIRAAKAGYKITGYPVEVSPRKTGRSSSVKLVTFPIVIRDIFCVWYSLHCKKNTV
jgi:glycosyltransferase involved in cell wall biosynthesis